MGPSEAKVERERDIPTRLGAIESSLQRLDDAIAAIAERTSIVRSDVSDTKNPEEKTGPIINTKLGRDLQVYVDKIETSIDRLNRLCSALEV